MLDYQTCGSHVLVGRILGFTLGGKIHCTGSVKVRLQLLLSLVPCGLLSVGRNFFFVHPAQKKSTGVRGSTLTFTNV
jgi:hypothetical protein